MPDTIAISPVTGLPEARPFSRVAPRTRVVATFLLVLIAIATATQVWLIRARAYADVELQTANQARAGAAFARQVFGGTQLALQSIDGDVGTSRIVVKGSAAELHVALKRAQATSPLIQGLALVDKGGRVWVNAETVNPPQPDLSDRSYFVAHRDGQDLRMRIDRPVLSRPYNNVSIPVSMRLSRPDGSFDGVVAARLDPAYLADFFAKLGADTISLIDGEGNLYARHPAIDLLAAGPRPVPSRESYGEVRHFKVPETGSLRMAVAYPVEGTDLIVLASTPSGDIEREWVHRSNGPILVGLAMAFIVLAVTAAVRRRGRQAVALIERHVAEASQFRDIARNKSDFLAHMGHEIRTPLNAIIGFSDVISTDAMKLGAPARYRDYAGDIRFSAEHLLGVINRILDMSKIEAGKWKLTLGPVNAAGIVATVRMLAAQSAEKEGVTVDAVDVDPQLSLVADEGVLVQLLLNLAINAIRFAGSDRRVELGCKRNTDGDIEFRVTDRGRGMTPADAVRALRPFETAQDDDLAVQRSNTGLGLPLARMFAELHGGTLEIDTAPGKGTSVRVVLPQISPG